MLTPPRRHTPNPVKILLTLLLLGALLFVCVGLYLVHITPPGRRSLILDIVRMFSNPQRAEEEAFPGKDRILVLVLGLDVNWTRRNIMHTKRARSDTMMLANIFLKKKKVRLLSIPRDTRVRIPSAGWEKINAAHAIGGPRLARRVLEELLGVRIDYHLVIKFNGLKNMVDAVGGVDVDVEKNMDYDDTWGHLHIHLKKGRHHLSGQKAMEYSRFRNDAEGDYGRIRRQQQLIKALQREILKPENLSTIPALAEIALSNVTTDLTQQQLLSLGFSLRNLAPADMSAFTLPTVPKDYKEGRYWVSYVDIVEEQAPTLLKHFLSAAPLAGGAGTHPPDGMVIPHLSVEVLDGGGNPGRAEKVAAILQEAGFTITRVSHLDAHHDRTQILDYTGRGNGLIIAKILHFGNPVSLPNPERTVDVTVLIGTE